MGRGGREGGWGGEGGRMGRGGEGGRVGIGGWVVYCMGGWVTTHWPYAEEVGTSHVSSKNADVVPLTLYGFLKKIYNGCISSSGPFQQEGREI